MINLIPNQQKKKMVRSFYYRLAVLVLVMLSASLCIASVALLPAYFLSLSKNNAATENLEIQKNKMMPEVNQESLATVTDLNNKLGVVERAEQAKFIVSERVLNAVIASKISGIKITEFYCENSPIDGRKITISGTAPSREVLLVFRQILEKDTSFKKVDLPISNFVKGADIPFHLNITLL